MGKKIVKNLPVKKSVKKESEVNELHQSFVDNAQEYYNTPEQLEMVNNAREAQAEQFASQK